MKTTYVSIESIMLLSRLIKLNILQVTHRPTYVGAEARMAYQRQAVINIFEQLIELLHLSSFYSALSQLNGNWARSTSRSLEGS